MLNNQPPEHQGGGGGLGLGAKLHPGPDNPKPDQIRSNKDGVLVNPRRTEQEKDQRYAGAY